jgi:ubiquinone/menaquinone biosynthesis C-methylase UbiE
MIARTSPSRSIGTDIEEHPVPDAPNRTGSSTIRMNRRLPGYEPMLAAYHRAFASELRGIVHALPISQGQAVLDMACGDGAYGPWLAECVGPNGRVVAVDKVPEYLDVAREANPGGDMEFICAPIEALPFPDGTFDFCWCAQSLYSLPDPVQALNHMLRVTKPGGFVGVLESDTLHHVLLPWPIEVELAVRAAELVALAEESDRPRKFYVGRDLRAVFRRAGLEDFTLRTFAHDRAAPLGPDERLYIIEHLKELSGRVAKHVDGAIRQRFETLADPASGHSLVEDPDLTATFIDQLAWGRKPG